ncbi:16S rRNA (cytidine(1402)-2'-O)-methyltransferase [Arthrobacter echini]|uniref:Ribosomal RNA small subunit methyltransferase I n=1 Tax=Arthrobacter echini TaxID=1529066 RepID=A0A5D0XTN3_9MICC|nr:16S rRNA (cytidine(1402)-2'-O)-methyltransferase [Arthrobacter echini]
MGDPVDGGSDTADSGAAAAAGATPDTSRAVGTAYRGTTGDGSGRGRVVLAATPIGNMGDATERLIGLLQTADVVAAEDTRRLHRLLQGLGVGLSGRVISYHEHNEAERTPELLDLVRDGATVLLVTDAGMPAVSDPGYRLVRAAVEEDLDLTVVPGASAVLAALALSGLPTDRFCFEGFLPRKAGLRAGRLADLVSERRTMVFFEAPHRLEAMLRSLQQEFGSDRQAAVARELTKVHEQVIRGSLLDLLQWAQDGEVRGELAVVVAGAADAPPTRPEDHVSEVTVLLDGGMRLKDAVAAVSAERRVSKRELYAAVIASR